MISLGKGEVRWNHREVADASEPKPWWFKHCRQLEEPSQNEPEGIGVEVRAEDAQRGLQRH